MTFIPGLEIGRLFYRDVISPILNERFAGLKHAAGLIGPGSEVLGFDTELSTDHDWRPRVFLFLSEQDRVEVGQNLEDALNAEIPDMFQGFSTRSEKPDDLRTQIVFSVDEFWRRVLGFSLKQVPSFNDWLTFPEHILRGLVSGAVYRDDTGELAWAREAFSYYPDDLWRYMLAAQWIRISQEEAFMGRCGDVGDELGSRIIASGLVKDLMRLCFLMERQYAPYSKWFGTAFKNLACGPKLDPLMLDVLAQPNWKEREKALSLLYQRVAEEFNGRKILVEPLDTKVTGYYTRPYAVIGAGRFAEALKCSIQSPELRHMPPVGSVSQFVDSTDILEKPELCARLRSLYSA